MFPFRIVNSFEINVKVKCFTEFRRKKKKEGEKILAVECYVCVFVCVSVCIQLSLLQGKIKAYINTQLSERDINHNKEISGHIRGSVVQLLGRRRKEQVLKGIPSRAPTNNASSAPAPGLSFLLSPERPLVVLGAHAGRCWSGLTLTSPHCVSSTVIHGRVLRCHAAQ